MAADCEVCERQLGYGPSDCDPCTEVRAWEAEQAETQAKEEEAEVDTELEVA